MPLAGKQCVSAFASVPSPHLHRASYASSEPQHGEITKELHETIHQLSHQVENHTEHFDNEINVVKTDSLQLHRQIRMQASEIRKQASEINELKSRLAALERQLS